MKVSATGAGEIFDTLTELLRSILGGIEKNGTWLGDEESTEARTSGSNGDSDFESEPGLAGFGNAPNHTHGAAAP